MLKNPVGSAPGFCLTWKKALIVSLPGVPREMEEMMRQEVVPLLRAATESSGRSSRSPIVRQVFHTFGLAEADVDAKLKGLIPKGAPGRLGAARIAHGRAGLADDEGEPICSGEES